MRCYVEKLSVLMCLMVQKKAHRKEVQNGHRWWRIFLVFKACILIKVDNRAVRDRYNLLSMSLELNIEVERSKGEDIRKKATETLRETQKRKIDEGGVKLGKKMRSNGSDTMRYLKEKNEKMLELEQKKMQMKERNLDAASKRHEELMATMQQQHQQQMETF